MRRACALAFVLAFCCAVETAAQPPEAGRKQARAIRVGAGTIVIDGRLDEEVWSRRPAIADFVQKEPAKGARLPTRFRSTFAYDDTALYVGARMSSEHAPIQAPLGRRDDVGQAEYIMVALDTYLDHRTAYSSASPRRASGSIASIRPMPRTSTPIRSGVGGRTRVDGDGWTAEMWIPLSQLRFNASDEQVWGLNVLRFVPSNNESDTGLPCRGPRRPGRRVRRAARYRRREAAASPRAAAVCRRLVNAHRQPRSPQPVRRWEESGGARRRGREDRLRIRTSRSTRP